MKNQSIIIDAGPKNNLKWPTLEGEIDKALEEVEELSFEVDFGLDPMSFNFKDEITFFSLSIAVGEFIKRVCDRYLEKINSVFLYRGRGDFTHLILNNKIMYQEFLIWKEELFLDKPVTPHMLHLFSIQLLMRYLHQLAAALPDGFDTLVSIEGINKFRPAYKVELLSDEHFSYITSNQEVNENASIAVVLPQIGKVDYDELDKLLLFLNENKIEYRVIPEKLLTEKWYGVDELIVLSHTITTEGVRMLQGFNAALGSIIFAGDHISGVKGELFEERFGAEGFEPPTFWSQTRRASQAALCPE